MSYLSEGPPYTVMRVLDRQRGAFETKTTDLGERSYGAKKPVYVLTSSYTFSGGEEFAYDVQAFKRGVIVGQTTGGGANPGGPQPLGHGFTVFVPMGLAKHPRDGCELGRRRRGAGRARRSRAGFARSASACRGVARRHVRRAAGRSAARDCIGSC
jgi:hypothetical protein